MGNEECAALDRNAVGAETPRERGGTLILDYIENVIYSLDQTFGDSYGSKKISLLNSLFKRQVMSFFEIAKHSIKSVGSLMGICKSRKTGTLINANYSRGSRRSEDLTTSFNVSWLADSFLCSLDKPHILEIDL